MADGKKTVTENFLTDEVFGSLLGELGARGVVAGGQKLLGTLLGLGGQHVMKIDEEYRRDKHKASLVQPSLARIMRENEGRFHLLQAALAGRFTALLPTPFPVTVDIMETLFRLIFYREYFGESLEARRVQRQFEQQTAATDASKPPQTPPADVEFVILENYTFPFRPPALMRIPVIAHEYERQIMADMDRFELILEEKGFDAFIEELGRSTPNEARGWFDTLKHYASKVKEHKGDLGEFLDEHDIVTDEVREARPDNRSGWTKVKDAILGGRSN